MNCACLVEYDGDCVNMIIERHIATRRNRTCHECHRDIPAGEPYLYERYECDGRKDTHRTCSECESIRDHMTCGFTYGNLLWDLVDAIEDNGCGVSEECLAKITAKARTVVCGIVEECWERLEDSEEEGENANDPRQLP